MVQAGGAVPTRRLPPNPLCVWADYQPLLPVNPRVGIWQPQAATRAYAGVTPASEAPLLMLAGTPQKQNSSRGTATAWRMTGAVLRDAVRILWEAAC